MTLSETVAAHSARLDAQHERQDSQDAAILRVEGKIDKQGGRIDMGLIAALGALIAGILNLVKHG